MSTASYGTPAEIESLPTPAATVNIASSTTGANTVITTGSAHGLQTGQAAIINGHLVNTDANGVWIVTVLTSTTFRISAFADSPGVYVTGNGNGVATGTVQSLALPGISIPEDAVDDIDAASVNVPFEGLHDMVQWLAYKILADMGILAGGTLTTAAGSTATLAGTVAMTGTTFLNGTTTINGATEATDDFEISGTTYLSNLVRYSAPDRLTDADHTISTASGYTVILETTTANTTRTITLNQTSAPVPLEGERLMICGSAQMGAPAADLNYIIQREGGTEIAYLYGTQTWLEVQFEGGVWRALRSSGYSAVAGNGVYGNVVRKAGW